MLLCQVSTYPLTPSETRHGGEGEPRLPGGPGATRTRRRTSSSSRSRSRSRNRRVARPGELLGLIPLWASKCSQSSHCGCPLPCLLLLLPGQVRSSDFTQCNRHLIERRDSQNCQKAIPLLSLPCPRSSMVINCRQRSSTVLNGHQWSSTFINGHQRQ